MKKFNRIIGYEKKNGMYYVKSDNGGALLCFMTDDIIRMRVSFDEKFVEESYVLTMTAWEDRFDSFLGSERTRVMPVEVLVEDGAEALVFQTATLKLILYKENFAVELYNGQGKKIYSDMRGKAFLKDHKERVRHYNEIFNGDRFYGFGEQAGRMDKLGSYIRMSPKDSIGYHPEYMSCLYKHIPFYIRVNEQANHALGLFYHNTYESVFNMGNERSGYWPYYSYFEAEGGDLDIFFINGPSFAEVVERYTRLTGRTFFAPKYALGYLGSTMYYAELPENCDREILDFVDKTIDCGIPIDGFQLSSGYTSGSDNKRYVFTWNNKRFPDPSSFFAEMNGLGVPVTPNIKPGILTTHPYYEEMRKRGVFVGAAYDADTPYVDSWWGGAGSFIDFTNPRGRALWSKLLREQLVEKGVSSIWNDNNEYDSVEDRLALCDFDGSTAPIARLRPLHSLLMNKIGNETIFDVFPNTRPFSVTRGGFAGFQRYASSWAGDNSTCWESLRYNLCTILGMGLCGVANYGADVGGFFGPASDAELLVRWVQHGIFMPRFSIHSSNNDNTVTEPWMFSDKTRYITDAIKLRYSFIPYMYSLLHGASVDGTPILRPLFYEFQGDVNCYDRDDEFMFGPSILVANVLERGADKISVYLPAGCCWYDFNTRERFEGGQTFEIPVTIDSIPLFIRGSAIVPRTEGIKSIAKDKMTLLNLLITHDRDVAFVMYDDDGISLDYQTGQYLKTTISVSGDTRMNIRFEKEGKHQSTVESVILDIVHREKGPMWVTVGDAPLKQFLCRDKWESADEGWYYSNSKRSALVRYKEREGSYTVTASFEQFDLIGMVEDSGCNL